MRDVNIFGSNDNGNLPKVEAASYSHTFAESTKRSQTHTLTIPNLKIVNNVTVNTGNVTYSVSGESITLTFSNGSVSRRIQTGGSPADSKSITGYNPTTAYIFTNAAKYGSTSSGTCVVSMPPRTLNYNDGTYSGTLNGADGFPISYLGACTTATGEKQTNASVPYSYSGTVYKPDTRTYSDYYQYTVNIIYTNNAIPTITLSSLNENLVLSESNNFQIEGKATDADEGNVLTVKYKINNGPSQALQSGVSDGSTPLSFAKTLTYSNKRMRDGSTDVTGVDLAENIDHTLTVWAEDDQGGKSTEEIRIFRVIHNRAPSISDENRELGNVTAIPSITYTVTDPEQNSFTITEKINGNTIRTFSGVANQQETITIPARQWIRLEPGVPHTLTITATDNSGLTSNRVFTFTRVVDQIMFEGLETPMETDIAAERILLTPDWTIPLGAEVRVEACNNGFDAEPTWEDCTIPAKMGRGFAFLNTSKTAEKWGVNFRVRISKGNSTSEASFSGIGGAYDVQ